MSNPFETYGHAKGTREKPVRVTGKERAPLKKTGLEKQQEEDAKLSQLYRRTRAEELRKLLAGEYGVAIANLRKILRDFHRDKVPDLLRHMESRDWYADASLETRASLLSMISVAIVRARERDGRAPFDDPLPSFNIQICPECSGTGTPNHYLSDRSERECWKCQGMGEIAVPAPEGLFQICKRKLGIC